ncbi:DHA2 family efflux MFS transporter permease subunit [Williamsia sp.]|uniref:DHA2 family efflux MFS transporter permease subunit n=1 Tax=Williamsia sp. TaxID=1872085 RepID=UPI0025F0BC29|nr:DHA2 family efflux MFS transporter permease subunit [Williamsia sp.]
MIGFFMILVDSTIMSVATPAIMRDLRIDLSSAVWVTSAYLLAYAVPLLISGRLGDRFGTKNVYLAGLGVFTLASFACGLAGDFTSLVAARVVQGLGAALIAPQTMAVITRIFPADNRGPALAMWGTIGGLGGLVGPQLGGLIVGTTSWSWIFFINIPIGVIGFVLALKHVPRLPASSHRLDVLGVVLSGAGMFCLVFGVQEGDRYNWGTITNWLSVPLLIGAGLALLAAFVLWQARNKSEPLIPLQLFTHRDFSLAGIAMATMGFAITCIALPLMLYAQNARGFSPTESALLLLPLALVMAVAAPVVGRLIGRFSARTLATAGFTCTLGSLFWLGAILRPDTPIWQLEIPIALIGLGNAFIGSPLSTTAVRSLPLALAGAGSGAFNAIRQLGAVLGAASIATLMTARLNAEMPGAATEMNEAYEYAAAMGQSLFLAAAVLILGLSASMFFTTGTPKAATASESLITGADRVA